MSALPFFLIPFLGGNHLSLFYVTIDKFWIETIFIFTLIIAVSFNFYRKRVIPPGFLKFIFYFLPFILINTVSYFYTWNRFNTLCELNIIAWIIGCIYLYTISENKDALIKTLICGTALSVLCMVIQYKILFPKLLEIFKDGMYSPIIKGKTVPFSSFLNEATLGGYFLFVIPLSIYFGVIKKKILYMLISSIIIFGLLFSLSRMGMLIGALSAIACFLLVIRTRGIKSSVFLILIVLLALSVLLSVVYTGEKRCNVDFQNRVIDKVKNTPTHISTLTYRTVTWKTGINAFLDKPLLGYGAGTFEHAYRKYYEAALYTKYAHNIFIKIIVELGLTGLMCFLIYIYGFIVCTIRFARNSKGKDAGYLFIALSAISGLLFAVFNVTFEMPAYAITFFILSSALFASEDEVADNTHRTGQRHRALAIIIFFLIITLLMGSFYFTEKSNISEKLNEEGAIFTENGLLQQAFVSYRESINTMPINDYGYVGIMNVLLRSYKIEQSAYDKKRIKNIIIQYLPHIEHNRDKYSELYFLAGSANSLLGNNEKADNYFNKALQYYPSSGFFMFKTASFYFLNGNTGKAKTLINRMKTYVDRHTFSEMHGLYVYMMRDLESSIEYMEGNIQNALELAGKNLEDAEKDENIAKNILAREYVEKDSFIRSLEDRVDFYRSKIKK
jgi:O-antigen ligase